MINSNFCWQANKTKKLYFSNRSNFKKLLLKYNDIKLLIIGDGEEKKILQDLITKTPHRR